ncbi:uncharacterized protein Z518_09717 [Rhinocladiella mackenziei CBS 650.93]|uniref:Uncharacterized protein n=1 Tax=Rhinocladiella mackenziei CBS 650.93 TaxID=1442369 RepID=A0A0D2FF60_9EURO|nr:uncharacterized protein Z518_09717 [Rhinocladiella mackenziei CBS 650.93]KIX00652.1 hypothetical protein Z518_09717 [Rhinocladiella mackenziei CBS 650.93]
MSFSSSKRYSIVEPHPSIPASHYVSTGRGGAGNVTRAPASVTSGSDASGTAARVTLTAPSRDRKTFTAGRGGAGNVFPSSERAIFSFDEELEQQLVQERHAAPVFHVGRGGAGNVTSSQPRVFVDSSVRRRSEDSMGSTGSSESGADYVNRNIKKGLKKMAGVGNYMT